MCLQYDYGDRIKVSVVVPVYNAENYLGKCVESLLQQTLDEIEILLIDDGSTDDSLKICRSFQERDNKVVVFHKPNGGVSSARQFGIEHAHGEYIIHADSDDWVAPNMLEEMYAYAKSHQADLVIADYYRDTPKGSNLISQKPTNVDDNNAIILDFSKHLFGATWNKLIRASAIVESKVSFPKDVNYCEDLLFFFSLLLHPIKCVYLSKAFYHYNQVENSITTNFTKKSLQERLNAYEIVCQTLKGKTFYFSRQGFMLSVLQDALISGLCTQDEILEILDKCNFKYAYNHAATKRLKLALLLLKMKFVSLALSISKYK